MSVCVCERELKYCVSAHDRAVKQQQQQCCCVRAAGMSQNMAASDNNYRRRRRSAGGGGGGGGAGASACICIRCFDDLFSYFLRFRGSPEEIEQRHKSRQIDKTLRREDKARKRQV